MFDIGWSELVVIAVVALIAIGPKELPGVLRTMGQWMGKIRRMANEFQDQFREAMREAEVADLKRQFDEASAQAASAFNNPLQNAQKEVEQAFASADPARITAAGTAEPPADPLPAEIAVAPAEASVVPAEPESGSKPESKSESKSESKPGGGA